MKLSIPKPTMPDLVAIAIAALGAAVAAVSWGLAMSKGAGQALSNGEAVGIALIQLAICTASLFALGMTARRGTIIGNLASLSGMMIGISGGLLAAALWTLA